MEVAQEELLETFEEFELDLEVEDDFRESQAGVDGGGRSTLLRLQKR